VSASVTPPLWPEPNQKLEAAVGRALISWSVLEREVDSALELVLRIDPQVALCVTANLGTKARLDIFKASVHSLWHSEPEEETAAQTSASAKLLQSWIEAKNAFVGEADRLVHDTERMAGEFRNWMAHSQPLLLHFTDDEHHLMWGKFSARKGGVRGKIARLSPDRFDKATSEIRGLVERWHLLRQRLSRKVELLDEIEREGA
jgi:hypothetical protein